MHQFFEQTITLPCKQEAAWKLLTTSEMTRQYMYGCDVLSDWQVGSALLWEGPDGKGGRTVFVNGTIVAIDPGQMVEFTMFPTGAPMPDIPENYLHQRYTLASDGDTTRLTIWQGDFTQIANGQQRYADSQKGWDTVILEMIRLATELDKA
ncbi:MAG: SRPBCC domain-containing protein [Bacteroidota bacterium]